MFLNWCIFRGSIAFWTFQAIFPCDSEIDPTTSEGQVDFKPKMATRVAKQIEIVNGIPTLISRIHAANFDISQCKKAVILIPGNPGIVRFYDAFLEHLFYKCDGKIPMFGIQHAGILLYF